MTVGRPVSTQLMQPSELQPWKASFPERTAAALAHMQPQLQAANPQSCNGQQGYAIQTEEGAQPASLQGQAGGDCQEAAASPADMSFTADGSRAELLVGAPPADALRPAAAVAAAVKGQHGVAPAPSAAAEESAPWPAPSNGDQNAGKVQAGAALSSLPVQAERAAAPAATISQGPALQLMAERTSQHMRADEAAITEAGEHCQQPAAEGRATSVRGRRQTRRMTRAVSAASSATAEHQAAPAGRKRRRSCLQLKDAADAELAAASGAAAASKRRLSGIKEEPEAAEPPPVGAEVQTLLNALPAVCNAVPESWR